MKKQTSKEKNTVVCGETFGFLFLSMDPLSAFISLRFKLVSICDKKKI